MSDSLYPSLSQFNTNVCDTTNNNNNNSNVNNFKTGWLQKKGDGVAQSWKKRYFVVDPESIKYYTDDARKNLKGAILWNTIISIEFTKFKISSDTRYFQISTNKRNRVYYLFAEDQLISLEWVNYLQSLLQQYISFTNNNNNNSGQEQPSNEQQQQQQEYQYYQEEQQFNNPNNNNSFNSNESQYKDFLNYTTPYFSHYSSIMNHNPNGTSENNMGVSDSKGMHGILVPPPRPPGQLRTLGLQSPVKEILPIEGMDLEIYYQSTCYFSNIILTIGDDYNILSIYLILSVLDWDNKKSQPLPYPCTPPYESDIVFPYFVYCHQLARNEVLQHFKNEGPSYCTQIDNFAKKKRKYYTLLLENEDRETFLQRNLLLLSYIQTELLPGTRFAQLEDAIQVLVDRFIENLETLPSIKFSNSLFKEIEAAQLQQSQAMLASSPSHGMSNSSNEDFLPSLVQQQQNIAQQLNLSDSDHQTLKHFVYSYLLFQKFHLERKNNDKIPFPSALQQKIENVGHCFSQILQKSPLVSPFQNHIRTRMLRIFFIWQKDLPLCETTCTHDISNYRNFKVFSRMASKVNQSMFPQLYNSIKDVKTSLYQYIEPLVGSLDLNNMDSFPLDSLI